MIDDFRTTSVMENGHEIWNLECQATVSMWAFVKTVMNLQIISKIGSYCCDYNNKHVGKKPSSTTQKFLLLVYGSYYNMFWHKGTIFR